MTEFKTGTCRIQIGSQNHDRWFIEKPGSRKTHIYSTEEGRDAALKQYESGRIGWMCSYGTTRTGGDLHGGMYYNIKYDEIPLKDKIRSLYAILGVDKSEDRKKIFLSVQDQEGSVVRSDIAVDPAELARLLNGFVPGLTVTYNPPVELPKELGSVVVDSSGHKYVRVSASIWVCSSGLAFVTDDTVKNALLQGGEER